MSNTARITIRGNVVADPRIAGGLDNPERVTFRVISNRRRFEPESGQWADVGEVGMNVVCWRKLARGVANSIHRGCPVLVSGRLNQHEWVDDKGAKRWSYEISADFVGTDLNQGIHSKFTRFTKIDAPQGSPASGEEQDGGWTTGGQQTDNVAADGGSDADPAGTDGLVATPVF